MAGEHLLLLCMLFDHVKQLVSLQNTACTICMGPGDIGSKSGRSSVCCSAQPVSSLQLQPHPGERSAHVYE